MKFPSKTNLMSTGVVVGLVAVLIVLATLQYHWSFEVSEAAGARMKAGLQSSMVGFRQDLHRELSAIPAAFQTEPVSDARDLLSRDAQQYQAWNRTAAHPGLIADVFIFEGAGGKHSRFLRLNRASNRFEAVNWPSSFGPLKNRLAAASADFGAVAARSRPPDGGHRTYAGIVRAPNPEHHGPSGPPWAVDEIIPALIHGVVVWPGENSRTTRAQAPSMDWMIVELDRAVLNEHLMPELAERHFSGAEGLEYSVAILSNGGTPVIYSSDSGFGAHGTAGSDASLELFGPIGLPGPGRAIFLPRRQPAEESGRQYEARLPRFEPLHYSAHDKDWLLIVKHRKGSLDAVVAGMRMRSLSISFGVLLVLAATMAMIIIASQRSKRLAKLQMDFVAGVSHELRTPLAVISSAADNIADGVIDGKQQLLRYGNVIKKQAAQLNGLVEQILLFAATRKDRLSYNLRPLAVPDIIKAALNSTAELVHGAGFRIEQSIAPNLPPVMGDQSAISQCLQNLITNAVKYGGSDRWIGIRVEAGPEESRGHYVRISVADHGAGIDRSDLKRIFEPFYRTPAVTAAQIHGSGLGLPLARSIAEAMGGHLDVSSKPGHGSSFTLHLRVAGEVAPGTVLEAAAGLNSTPTGRG